MGEHKHFRIALQEGRQLIYIHQKSKRLDMKNPMKTNPPMEAKDKGNNPCKPKKETAWSEDPLCLDQMLRERQNGPVHGKYSRWDAETHLHEVTELLFFDSNILQLAGL